MEIQSNTLDVEEALRRFNGNMAMFSKLLRRFVEINSNIEEKTMNVLSSGDFEEIFIYFHSLKGGFGNLSAKNLYEKSAVFEKYARNEDLDSIKNDLQTFYDLYSQLKIAVANLENPHS